ncbi:MAG: TetR family transcriptional regulator, partial [Polaromonas sp.]
YVRDPRNSLEPANAQSALMRGGHHVLSLLVPYLESSQRSHLQALVGAYSTPASSPT